MANKIAKYDHYNKLLIVIYKGVLKWESKLTVFFQLQFGRKQKL